MIIRCIVKRIKKRKLELLRRVDEVTDEESVGRHYWKMTGPAAI